MLHRGGILNIYAMELHVLSFYFGIFNIYGFELFNIDMEDNSRSLLCLTWSPKVAMWIDILFIRIHIEL